MKEAIYKLLGIRSAQTSGFSTFFREASSSEKKKVIKKVIREANKDQRKLVEKADRLLRAN